MEKFFSIVRGLGLKRGPQRWLGGVCGGIAEKLNVDVAFVRIGFLLFCLLPGPAVCSTSRRGWSSRTRTTPSPLQSFLDKRGNRY